MGKEKDELDKFLHWSFDSIPQKEYRFHPTRRWRIDFAFVNEKVAVEYEGMPFHAKSRHTTVSGFTGDCEKYNELTILGWRLIRVNAILLKSGVAYRQLERILGRKGVKS